jgi:hypothetical protein
MTFEERIDKLTERHEALAQTVELLAHRMEDLTAAMARSDNRQAQIMEGIARLLHVAEIHEQRLERLEEGHEQS